jgi:hypothetical protein
VAANSQTARGTAPLAPDLREKLAGLIAWDGSVRATARRLGVSRSVVERGRDGLPLREGSRVLLGRAIETKGDLR